MSLIEQYRQVHASRAYGKSSVKRAPYVLAHIRALKPGSVIDYGCGQSTLPDMIRDSGVATVARYDPAIPAYAEEPRNRFDLLVSIDVLEHIPEEGIDDVLQHMKTLSEKALIIIDHRPAKFILPNGLNAHATVRPADWWRKRLERVYPVVERIPGVFRRPASFRTWHPSFTQRLVISLATPTDHLGRLIRSAIRAADARPSGSSPHAGAAGNPIPKIGGGYPDVVSSGDQNLDLKAATSGQAGTSSRNDKATAQLFSSYNLKRFFGVYCFPVLIMVGGGVVVPNPDGVLFVAVTWMLIAGRYIRS